MAKTTENDASMGAAEVHTSQTSRAMGNVDSEWTLQKIIDQLESCNFECEAGNLTNNVAWQALVRMAAAQNQIGE